MKQSSKLYFLLALSIILASCSSIKVLNSWKSDKASSMRNQNILVIARTANPDIRKLLEDELCAQLKQEGFKATASYLSLPKVDPNKKLSEEEVEAFKEKFRSQGYNGVVMTAIKEVEELSRINKEGGHYTGGTYYGYNPYYYGYFYGYYNHPQSYVSRGVWEEEKMELQTAYNFVLESLAYNLELPEKEQLVTIVTTRIEEPDELKFTAKSYVKKMLQALKK